MELTANVWPVVDSVIGLVLRYFMRAYVMEASDQVIRATLHALASTDFRIAKMFTIPPRFKVVSEFGTIDGCVSIAGFHEDQAAILEPAFRDLEKDFARHQGLFLKSPNDTPIGISLIPRFPRDPYLLITPLLETTDGELLPQARA